MGYEELVDGSNCETAGDQLCSTPADPYGFIRDEADEWIPRDPKGIVYNDGCEFISQLKDANGDYFSPSTTNMMSHYPCKCHFTHEQFSIMVDNYNKANHKLY